MRAVAYGDDGVAEPGDAHLVCEARDADDLVDACRSVLAHVGPGDALAISCFWHSLLPVDVHDRPLSPVLMWRERTGEIPSLDPVAYHERTGCFLHPSFWPLKIARTPGARYLSFARLPAAEADRRAGDECLDGERHRLLRPEPARVGRETLAACGVATTQLAPLSDEPIAGVWPALGDGACSNVGSGCVSRERAAVMVGTSAATRVVFAADSVEPRPGLFLYRLDGGRFCLGGALSDGGNLYAWLGQTLHEPIGEPSPEHGLTFLPFLGGERSLGWDPDRRGLIAGLTFATTPADIAQAALEGVMYRIADVIAAIGDVESYVATGAGLLANKRWVQTLADVLGKPVDVSAVAEGSSRGAAMVALERLGLPVPPAQIAHAVEPRAERYEIHQAAIEEQRKLMRTQEA